MQARRTLQDEWRTLQRRLVEHLAPPRSSDLGDGPTRLPAHVYTDPVRFEAERARVFRSEPLLACLSKEIPEPGDRLLFDEAGPPIVVVRDTERRVRAFLNLCPHRGGRLVETCESSRRLICPFHAWSFHLDGRLATIAHEPAFEGVDKDDVRLVEVPVEEWCGVVFVRATPDAGPVDAEAFLGDIAPVLEALRLDELECVRTDRFEVESNWKIALDTFCETYHVPALHRESLAQNLVPYVTAFDHYGRHHRYSGPGLDMEALVGRPESEWPADGYQAVHFLFPNTTIAYTHAFDGETPVVSMFRLFPGRHVGHSITIGSTYRRSDAPDATNAEVAEMHRIVLEIVQNEDYRIARDAFASLAHAPPDFEVTLGRTEPLLQRYHEDLAELTDLPIRGRA